MEAYLNETGIMMDNFLFCLSDNGDCLSQWRGYCPDGGGAIELDLAFPRTYSVLHANYEKTNCYELVENVPIQVAYVQKEDTLCEAIMRELRDMEGKPNAMLKAHSLIPYFKHAAFREESEWRLLFENTGNELSSCIRFRTLRNGAKVPYLVVKCGDVGKNFSRCPLDAEMITEKILDEKWKESGQIEIPQGNDQEKVYYKVKEKVFAFNKKRSEYQKLKIVCAGHLPVQRIILAPTYNRARLKEEVQRFCASVYWLQDVDVICSEIPYIPPSE